MASILSSLAVRLFWQIEPHLISALADAAKRILADYTARAKAGTLDPSLSVLGDILIRLNDDASPPAAVA